MSEQKIISIKEIEKVASLARINLTEQEKEKFSRELSDVLDNFKQLSQLDIENVETVNFLDTEKNQTREDVVVKNNTGQKEAIRKQFPRRKDDYLQVKAVL